MVFSKGYPAGSRWREQGEVNCVYSQRQSGFVDREIYTEWFTNVFLRYAPAERLLLLLQNGASAHLGPELIDRAIDNNIILLCLISIKAYSPAPVVWRGSLQTPHESPCCCHETGEDARRWIMGKQE